MSAENIERNDKIMKLYRGGIPGYKLAAQFNLTATAIYMIIRRRIKKESKSVGQV